MITQQDIWNCKLGQDKSLTIVPLVKNPNDEIGNIENHIVKCYKWCAKNLGAEENLWAKDGVTVYSWRIVFKHQEDALAFKLAFGL